MKTILIAIAAGTICFADSEEKIKMEDMPAAVQAAVKEQSKGATIKGFAKEVEHGKTFYEAEMIVNGHAKDISFDPTGKIASIEEETPIDSIPAPARETIQKSVGTGKLKMVETVTEGGKTFYEASITTGGKSKEVKVDPAGKIVK
jgi:uncharacterized membrane protein YkoI